MKKFVGYVNGKEYSSVEEFTKAVNETLATGESPMMISSYYKECNCGEDGCGCEHKAVEEKDEKKPLDLNTILLNRESLKYNGGSYIVPSNMKELFDNASNKGEIEKELELKISTNKKELDASNNKISKFEHMLKEATNDRNEASNQLEYYTKLLSILNSDEEVEKDVKEGVRDNNENNNSKIFVSESLKKNDKAYDIIVDVLKGFDDYLKDIGFWKK